MARSFASLHLTTEMCEILQDLVMRKGQAFFFCHPVFFQYIRAPWSWPKRRSSSSSSISRTSNKTFKESAKINTSIKTRPVTLLLPFDASQCLCSKALLNIQSTLVLKNDETGTHSCLTPIVTGGRLNAPWQHFTQNTAQECTPANTRMILADSPPEIWKSRSFRGPLKAMQWNESPFFYRHCKHTLSTDCTHT